MATVAELNDAVQALNFSLAVQDSIEQTGKGIIERNQQQLQEGKDSTGQSLEYPYRNPDYNRLKLQMNPRGVRDLKLTGSFYNGMIVGVAPTAFYITSKDSKTNKLIKNEGEDIFGLTPDNTGDYAQNEVLPVLQDKIEKQTGLKFT